METDIDEIRRFLASKKRLRVKSQESPEPVVDFEEDDAPPPPEEMPRKKVIED